jgi:hypothetical protein
VWNAAVPDNDVTIERRHVCGSVVVKQGVFSGTRTGNLTTSDGQAISATGRSLSEPNVEVIDISTELELV